MPRGVFGKVLHENGGPGEHAMWRFLGSRVSHEYGGQGGGHGCRPFLEVGVVTVGWKLAGGPGGSLGRSCTKGGARGAMVPIPFGK